MRPKYLTARAFVDFINETRGVPVKLSRFRKDRMAKNGIAPKPAAVMGNRHLFTEDQADPYIAKLIQLGDNEQAA